MTTDYHEQTEKSIQQIRGSIVNYLKMEAPDKETLSDKVYGIAGGSSGAKLNKTIRNDNYLTKLTNNDAKMMESLNSLQEKIIAARKDNPEFYEQAKIYLSPISQITKAIGKLKAKDSRHAVYHGVNQLLNKIEDRLKIESGEVYNIDEQIRKNVEKETSDVNFETQLKGIKAIAASTGLSEEKIMEDLEKFVDEYKIKNEKAKA